MLEPQPSALSLLRRWVVDYFNSHDPAVCAEFIAQSYSLHIGDTVFSGRDTEWLPAVDAQMALFPGLAMTVHQTVCGPDWAAAYFSEHGATDGREAVWSGIAIYKAEGSVLTSCVAQEDYMTRQRQLKSGIADKIERPALAPWDTPSGTRDSAAEDAVRDWLMTGWPLNTAAIRVDDEHITDAPLRFDTTSVEVDVIQSDGPTVVFHAVQHGIYQGGLANVERSESAVHMHVNGMVRAEDGKVISGRIIRDRIALKVAVRGAGTP